MDWMGLNCRLKPCPFCGRRVTIDSVIQNYDGRIEARFDCVCGLSARFVQDNFVNQDDRRSLLPWEQWNERFEEK